MHDIYSAAFDVCCEHAQFNFNAMIVMQSLGFNGFKRKHRCAVKHLVDCQMRLANTLYDKFRIVLKPTYKPISYEPKGMKDHLTAWDTKLAQSITALGKLNKMHMDKVGQPFCIAEEAMCHMTKCYEKTGRWYKRLEDEKWSPISMHMLDDCIHKKYKEIEGD